VSKRASTSRRSSSTRRAGARGIIDPLFACLVFAAVALGTLTIATSARLVILWTTLVVLWLVYQEGKARTLEYRFAAVGRGALIGSAIALPLMVLALRSLITAIPILFVSRSDPSLAGVSSAALFVSLVLLAPFAEELFFRDVLQREQGLWVGVGLYAVAGLLLFLPTAGSYAVVLIAVVGIWSVLGVIYGFLFERFGLSTALASHVAVNLFLLFMPAFLHSLGLFSQ
jgi:membrane protease YdiL (CAAX protease family)